MIAIVVQVVLAQREGCNLKKGREKVYRMQRILVATVMFISVSIFGNRAMGQSAQSYMFLSGVESYALGDVELAELVFEELLKKNPTHAPSYFYLSKISLGLGDIEQGLDHIRQATIIDSTNLSYLELYISYLIDTGDYTTALDVSRRLQVLDPGDGTAILLEGSLLCDMGRVEEAFSASARYEQQFGIDGKLVELMCNCYIKGQMYGELLDYLGGIVALHPSDIGYVLMLANYNNALGQSSDARRYFLKALELDGTSLSALMPLGSMYLSEGNIGSYIGVLKEVFENDGMSAVEKVELFEQTFFSPEPYRNNFASIRSLITILLLEYPTDFDVRSLYGRYLIYTGEVDAAQKHYESMVQSGSMSSDVLQRLVEINLYKEQWGSAIELCERGIAQYGDFAFIHNKIVGQWLSGDSQGALSQISRSVRTVESDSLLSVLYGIEGDIYHELGSDTKSFRSYDKALRYDGDNSLVLNNYAYYLAQRGRKLDVALRMSQRANELSVDNPTYLDTEAWVLYAMGKIIDAQLLMKRALDLDPNPSGEVLMHYGDILWALGDDFLARSYWKRAREVDGESAEIVERLERER